MKKKRKIQNRRFSQPLYRHNHHVPSPIQNLKPSQTPIRNVRPVNAKLESSQTSQQDSGFRSLGTIRQKKEKAALICKKKNEFF